MKMNKKKRHHYTQCGLDYIYLANGFTRHETPYGSGVSIQDAEKLHEAIAREIISRPSRLRGREVRFLRSLLRLSQSGLAQLLGAKRLTVARWEANPATPIPGPSDRTLRLFYALKADGDELARQICEMLAEIDELECSEVVFQESAQGWERARAA